jgi:hypothetical protein
VAVTLVYLKWKEGRASCLGRHSKIGKARAVRREGIRSEGQFRIEPPMESPLDKNTRTADGHGRVGEGVPTLEIRD